MEPSRWGTDILWDLYYGTEILWNLAYVELRFYGTCICGTEILWDLADAEL